MKSLLLITGLIVLTASCGNKKTLPPGIFPLDKMKTLVWDLEIADQQASDHFAVQKDSLRMESTSLYQQVFAKHKTNKADFYKSFTFYESHPDLLKVLFDSVSSYGSRQKAAMYKKVY